MPARPLPAQRRTARARSCPPADPDVDRIGDTPPAGSGRWALELRSWLTRLVRRRYGAALPGLAEDLAHDAFLRLEPRRALIPPVRVRAYLARIADNLARDELRRRRRREFAGLAPEAQDADQEATLVAKQTLMALPQRERDVFLMSRISGLSNREIAEQTGLSVKTVEARMTRALAALTRALSR